MNTTDSYWLITKSIYLVLAVLFLEFVFSESFSEASKLGSFNPRPVITVYLVGDGKPCSTQILIRQGKRSDLGRFLVRVFDPDEKLLFWRYVEYTDDETIRETEPQKGIELRLNDREIREGEVLLKANIPVDSSGVYQLRVSTGNHEVSLHVKTQRDLLYGVCFQNGDFSSWKEKLSKLYAYVPVHAEELNLRGGQVIIRDESGKNIAHNIDKNSTKDISVKQHDIVWSFEFPVSDWSFRAAGFPLILCPNEEAARTIKASVEVLPDIELANFVENIPVARGGWKSLGAGITAKDKHDGMSQSDSFHVVDQTGAGVEIIFDRPQKLKLVPEGLKTSGWRKLQIGRVEVLLPTKLKAGTTLEIAYELQPIVKSE